MERDMVEDNYEQRLKSLEDRIAAIEEKLNVISSLQEAGQADNTTEDTPGRIIYTSFVQAPTFAKEEPDFAQSAQSEEPIQSQVASFAQTPSPESSKTASFTQTPLPESSKAVGKKDRDMESFIGRNVFVIIAAVLVFIGFIYFAGALFPYLSKAVWFAIMCVASIALTAVGYALTRRKESNLSVALLACGLGTVYITLFTGKLYFRMVNTFILFAALILLMLAVYHCSKYKSRLFNIIGQAGILVSLLICLGYAFMEHDRNFAMYAMLYVAVSEIAYDLLFGEKGYLINIISMLFAVTVLSFPVLMTAEKGLFFGIRFFHKSLSDIFSSFDMQLVGFLLMVLLFVYVIIRNAILMLKRRISAAKYAIVNILGFLVFLQAMSHLEYTVGVKLAMMLYCLIIMTVTELLFYDKERTASLHVLWDILLPVFLSLYVSDTLTLYVPCIIFTVPLAVYAFYTRTTFGRHTLYEGICFATFVNLTTSGLLFDREGINPPAICFYLICVLFALIWSALLFRYRDSAPAHLKIISYLVTLGNVYMLTYVMTGLGSWDYAALWGAWTVVGLLAIACLIQFSYKYLHGYSLCEKPCSAPAFIIQTVFNTLVILWALFDKLHFLSDINIFAYTSAVVLVIVLSLFNLNLMLKEKNTFWGVFVGLQTTLVLCVIMSSFNDWKARGFIVSITMLVCAVICILVGLKFSQKHLRVYALILALFSTVKLTLFDRSLESKMSTALSFFFCAILCFTISWLYSRIEKWARSAG